MVKPGRKVPQDARKRAVVRFEPGVHELGPWEVPQTVQQIYLAPGAFVNGALKIVDRERRFPFERSRDLVRSDHGLALSGTETQG